MVKPDYALMQILDTATKRRGTDPGGAAKSKVSKAQEPCNAKGESTRNNVASEEDGAPTSCPGLVGAHLAFG